MNYIFTVSGFTQKFWAKHGNGSRDIHKAMRKHAGEHTEIVICMWKQNPRGYARKVAADYKAGDKIQINVYSYGGGWWLMEFLDELNKIAPHIEVDTVVACDPVLRYPRYLFPLKIRAVIGKQTLELPSNVKRAVHFYQTNNKPGGDYFVVSEGTVLVSTEELDYTHSKIDNSAEYLEAATFEANRLFAA